MQDIEAFRSQLEPNTLAMIDRLRDIVRASYPSLVEQIKWNAPSFAINGQDLITLGLERNVGVRLVLHRGAKPKAVDGFLVDDPDKLAKWPAPDRGVILWKSTAEIDQVGTQLARICSSWVEQVGYDS